MSFPCLEGFRCCARSELKGYVGLEELRGDFRRREGKACYFCHSLGFSALSGASLRLR